MSSIIITYHHYYWIWSWHHQLMHLSRTMHPRAQLKVSCKRKVSQSES